jgi:hypothetical protein
MPPVRPPDLPPLGEITTPPPPPTAPPTAAPGLPTPPPGFGPLAPVATPDPRVDFDFGDESAATGERSGTDPSGRGEEDPRQQLIDLTGEATGSGGGSGEPADGDANPLAASIAKLARTAGEAVKTFAFPLSLTVLVVIFLLIQGELDRRDPKLAFAPVDSSKDMVHFE